MKSNIKLMLAIFILVSLAGCGTARFNPANVSYNVKCSNCFLQNDSLIKFELRTTVDKNNPIELKVRNNSGETIVIDKMMSTLTEEGNVVYQPVFIENPKYNTTSGNSYSSQRNVEIPGLYNPLYDVYYNSSGAEEYSNKYEVNYQPTDKVFVPPYSTATMRIYDIVQQTTKPYLNKRVLYFDNDEDMEIYKNSKSKLLRSLEINDYSLFVYYKNIYDKKWIPRELKIDFDDIQVK